MPNPVLSSPYSIPRPGTGSNDYSPAFWMSKCHPSLGTSHDFLTNRQETWLHCWYSTPTKMNKHMHIHILTFCHYKENIQFFMNPSSKYMERPLTTLQTRCSKLFFVASLKNYMNKAYRVYDNIRNNRRILPITLRIEK